MTQAIAPGATVGILGGGQLGRMIALAAARLGYRCHVYCPEQNSPASQVCAAATVAAYDDSAALARFAASVYFLHGMGFEIYQCFNANYC